MRNNIWKRGARAQDFFLMTKLPGTEEELKKW
jgi:hypothetical protein